MDVWCRKKTIINIEIIKVEFLKRYWIKCSLDMIKGCEWQGSFTTFWYLEKHKVIYFSVQNSTFFPSNIILVVLTAHIFPHIEQVCLSDGGVLS